MVQEAINKERWDIPAIREIALEHGCVGSCLCAVFGLPFGKTYTVIAEVFKARYGDGFWYDGFALPLDDPRRGAWEKCVKDSMPAVVERLREEAKAIYGAS
jgi:hypothetical protein